MLRTYLAVGLVAFLLALTLGFLLIPLLKRLKFGQNILSYVKEHASKSGTPTFGGLIFIPSAVLACLLLLKDVSRDFWVVVIIGLAYMCVGVMDDLLKKIHRENKGLSGWQKLFFQTAVALFAGLYCMKNGASEMELPFLGVVVEMGFWTLPISIFVFLVNKIKFLVLLIKGSGRIFINVVRGVYVHPRLHINCHI